MGDVPLPRKEDSKIQKKTKKQLIKRRIFYTMLAIVVLFSTVLGRLFHLQVIEAEALQQRASSQWTRTSTVSAKRGKIMDVNGIVLAQSGSADTMEVYIPNVTDPEGIAEACERILGLDYDSVYAKVTDKTRSAVIIKRQLTEEESRAMRACGFKGVSFSVDTKRYYPLKAFLTQVIGYTTIDGVGQDGIEATYDKYLAGTAGRLVYEKDGSGREIPYGSETYVEPEDGCDVVLTVDAVVQSSLEREVEECLAVNNANYAMGIVMDVKTGDIKALSVKPDFDLNAPPRNDLTALSALSRNRLVADSFEPGSVFKVMTLAAALEEGKVSSGSTFNCPGFKIVDGQRIKCWSTNHGHQTLAKAVQNSCNPSFMEMALRLGTDKFYEYIYNFGFGSSTNSGLNGEAGGIVRNQKYIKSFDLARIGFGQTIAATALQMATAISAVVNGGMLMQPHIIKGIYTTDGDTVLENEPLAVRRVISEETSAKVRELLVGVVEEGSGKNSYIPGYSIGGKTGTSQKYENGRIAPGKNVASFVAFFPAEDPKYLVYIIVDEPRVGTVYGSTCAAPYVRDVIADMLKYYGIAPNYDDGVNASNVNAEVPNVVGMKVSEAASALRQAGFTSAADGTGTVTAQAPQAGAIVPKKTSIQLYTSEPSEVYDLSEDEVTVPDLFGLSVGEAFEALDALGLKLQTAGDGRGKVVSQNPTPGKTVPVGTSISVILEYRDD
jgi:stage V sporulation protein D (sporulation-specific penicillin-binding protein)